MSQSTDDRGSKESVELLRLIESGVSIGVVTYDPLKNNRENRYLTDGEIGIIADALRATASAMAQSNGDAGSLAQFPEINMSNYDDDDVEALNNWGCEALIEITALRAQLASLKAEIAKSCDETRFAGSDAGCPRAIAAESERDSLRIEVETLQIALEAPTKEEIVVRAQLEAARKALEPFAEIAKELQPQLANDYKNTMHWATPTVGQFRAALAALTQSPDGPQS